MISRRMASPFSILSPFFSCIFMFCSSLLTCFFFTYTSFIESLLSMSCACVTDTFTTDFPLPVLSPSLQCFILAYVSHVTCCCCQGKRRMDWETGARGASVSYCIE